MLNGKAKGFLYQVVQCVATLLDAWPDSPGITGRDRVESVAGIKWNHRPGSRGIRGRDRLEFALNDLPELERHIQSGKMLSEDELQRLGESIHCVVHTVRG